MLYTGLLKQSDWILIASLTGEYQPISSMKSTEVSKDCKNVFLLIDCNCKPAVPLLYQIFHGLGGHGRYRSETHRLSLYSYSEPGS